MACVVKSSPCLLTAQWLGGFMASYATRRRCRKYRSVKGWIVACVPLKSRETSAIKWLLCSCETAVGEDKVRGNLTSTKSMESSKGQDRTGQGPCKATVIFERAWRSQGHFWWMEEGKCHIHFKKCSSNLPRDLQAGQLHFHPMKESTLECIFLYIEQNAVMGNNHGYRKGK